MLRNAEEMELLEDTNEHDARGGSVTAREDREGCVKVQYQYCSTLAGKYGTPGMDGDKLLALAKRSAGRGFKPSAFHG
jgi:hypothetical protein